MKINSVIKLGIALIVLIQTVQVAIAQVDLTQIDQNLMSEIIICDKEYGMDACEQNHPHMDSCLNHAVEMTHCHNSFQIGMALAPSRSALSVVELSYLNHLREIGLYYPEPALEFFKPPI